MVMKLKVIILLITGMLIATGFLLSYGPVNQLVEKDTSDKTAPSVEVPSWHVAEYWTYTVNTIYRSPVEIDMVVYDITSTDYLVGTDNRDHALVHSVYNINPMLGRQTLENLDVYENGVAKSLYKFPLTDGATWQNTLYEKELTAQATYTVESNEYWIIATAENGFMLEYNYVPEVNWFSSFRIVDEGGYDLFSMQLIEHGYDYEGKVYFMRAKDLFSTSSLYTDTGEFTVNGHPAYGDFDFIAAGVRSTENHRLTNVVLTSPGNYHYRVNSGIYTLTEIPNENGMWKADVISLPIRSYFIIPPLIEIQIAGVIEYTAEL